MFLTLLVILFTSQRNHQFASFALIFLLHGIIKYVTMYTHMVNDNNKIDKKQKAHPNLKARVLPHSLEAEQAVLGCLLIDENAPLHILSELKADDFYSPTHRTAYSAMQAVALKDKPVDIVTVITELEALGQTEDAGGLSYLNSLPHLYPSAANFASYTATVKKLSVLRRLIESASKIADKAFTGDAGDDSLQFAEAEIYALAEKFDKRNLVHGSEPLNRFMEELEQYKLDPSLKRGIPTGFKRLDKLLNGFQKSDLFIVAARPSEGKTSLGMNFITKAIFDGNRRTKAGKPDPYKCAVFSLEMSAEQLQKRLVCSVAKVGMERVNSTEELTGPEWKKLHSAKSKISKAHLYIDDSSLTTPIEILSKCRRLKREKGLDMVMVDYLQLMSSGKRVENRQQEIADITRTLKIAAKELEVPIILLSQMSRDIEKRKGEGKMPQMSDLRESGAIEQDADVILFIHRKYGINDTSVSDDERNKVQLVIAKHRNGERGIIDVKWNGPSVTFEDYDNYSYLNKSMPPETSDGTFTIDRDDYGNSESVSLKSAEELSAVPLRHDGDVEDIF